MTTTAHAQTLLIGSLLPCVLAACAASSEPSVTSTSDITQGSVDLGDPAVVAFYFNHSDTYRGDLHCTGTLVAPRVVMTAAHCAPRFGDEGAAMHVGLQRAGIGGAMIEEFVAVERIDVNARFDDANIELGYDVAFATLALAVTSVAPLPIRRTPMSSSDVGATVRFVGYGFDEHGGIGVKRHASNRIASVSGNSFIGGVGADTCNGDSGGPALMVVDGVEVVAGVTSFGDPSCTGSGSYTRVDVFAGEVDRAITQTENDVPANGPPPAAGPRVCESRATCLPGSGCTCTTGNVGAVCCTDVTCLGGAADPNNCSPRCRRCQ